MLYNTINLREFLWKDMSNNYHSVTSTFFTIEFLPERTIIYIDDKISSAMWKAHHLSIN